MDNRSFSITYSVEKSPEEVFAAVNDVRSWWTGQIEGRTDALGAEFTYRYEQLHRTTQKITEFVPGKKVVWHVVDSHIAFVADESEWRDSDIVFEIEQDGDKTALRFTHVGLMPAIECYDRCTRGWSFYINGSLRNLITTGKAQPAANEPRACG